MSTNQVSLQTKEFELLMNTLAPFVIPNMLDSAAIAVTTHLGGSDIYIPKRLKKTNEDATIKDMHTKGIGINEIARRMGVSNTTVKRAILE